MANIIKAGTMMPFKPGDFYQVTRIKGFYSKKFKTRMADYKLDFRNLSAIEPHEYGQKIEGMLNTAIETMVDGGPYDDYIRFYMNTPKLKNPINIPFMTVSELTGARILQKIQQVQNSNDEIILDEESVDIHIICTEKQEEGSGWNKDGSCKKRTLFDLVKWLGSKRCAVQINNTDEICFARALAVAIAHYNNAHAKTKDTQRIYELLRKSDRDPQREAAKLLHKEAQVPEGPCGLAEIQQFQNHIEADGYRIIVFSAEENFEKTFIGPKTCSKLLHFLLHNKHYDVISKPAALFNTSYYCSTCLTGMNHIKKHNCLGKCKSCCDPRCTEKGTYPHIKCQQCRRYFYTDTCLENHIENGTCKQLQRCAMCNYQYKTQEPHTCNMYTCSYCHQLVKNGHLCYIQQLPKKAVEYESTSSITHVVQGSRKRIQHDTHVQTTKKIKKQDPMLFYYDFEATQETGQHIANLVVVQREDGMQWIFDRKSSKNPRDAFCSWIFNTHCGAENPFPRVFIAHYGKAYDNYFILEYINRHNIFPTVISNGSKYLFVEVPQLNIKFIDSHNFIGSPLRAFPKTFQLTELKKGYFPHLFNTVENENYVGEMPPKDTYMPNKMTPEDHAHFEIWYHHHLQANYVFDMHKELLTYCISDVQILREGCEKFRAACVESYQIDPFTSSITIASFCHKVYRTHFMPSNSIGIVPAGGYGRIATYSTKSIRWLLWIAHSEHRTIAHARNGGEVKIGPYYVDGFDRENNVIYEFHGCLYHGCTSCYDQDMDSPLQHGTMGDAYAKSEERISCLQKMGYNTVIIWECEYEYLLRNNSIARAFITNTKIVSPLNPRDAFFGGRTNATQLLCKAKEDEEIAYYDFVSLYPAINKYGKLPVGHPEIILPECNEYLPGQYYGFIKCLVLPPRALYHPVLPYKTRGKLIFPLCRACADECQEICNHEELDRVIMGTWTTPELDKAVEKGYAVQKIFEIWHYKDTAEHGDKSFPKGLFGEYVNAMLKTKQEASGWPEYVKTKEEKDRFMESYLAKEGIKLDEENIVSNPGKRSLAKLMLNSLWGKFGQREEMTKTEYVNSRHRLLELIASKDTEVKDSRLVNDEMMMVTYSIKEEHSRASGFISVPIAAFTTALARLKLYDVLDVLQQSVLYMDTDSVIYVHKKDCDPLHYMLGQYLGNMTNEIENGHYIQEFVSGGPKNYAYTTSAGKQVWKIKGITQNYKTSKLINYDVIKSMITTEEGKKPVVIHDTTIVRDKYNMHLHTIKTSKTYSFMYDKGFVDTNLKAWPYGY